MSRKLPVIKPIQIVKILESVGFEKRRQTGSHLILRHPKTGKIIPIPIHSRELKRGTLMSILKQAELSRDELKDLI